jgi:hypothetical protein
MVLKQQPWDNLNRQKVLRYFRDLGSASISANGRELINEWSNMW